MSSNKQYSDEHISAYIDGELDADERARLVLDEQHDSELAERIASARMLKEKVQLAYARIEMPQQQRPHKPVTGLSLRHAAMAASVVLALAIVLNITLTDDNLDLQPARQMIASTAAVDARQIAAMAAGSERVVIDLNRYDSDSFDQTLDHLESLASMQRQQIEVVANSTGLRALDSNSSAHAERFSALAQRFDNLKVIACGQSLAMLAGIDDPVSLASSIGVTSSALEQFALRSSQGWRYIKLN